MKKPIVELSDCINCGICIDVCPEVFKENDAGFIDVEELDEYPEEDVLDAVRNCPEDCIYIPD